MMAVLGETTKVGSHPELERDFSRFEQIASRRGTSAVGIAATNGQPDEKKHQVLKPTGQRRSFYSICGSARGCSSE